MHQPDSSEYHAYYAGYVSLVGRDPIHVVLAEQPAVLRIMAGDVPEKRGTFSYARGKWTIKELLGHIIDSERVFGYRAFRISRGDATPIEGFEQDDYVRNGGANERSFADLLDEFELVRLANILLFDNLAPDAWRRVGTANGNAISVRALAYIMVGHVRHHANILRERYLL